MRVARDDSNREEFPKFRIALHDPMMPPDLRSMGVDVKPGYLSTFLITPSDIMTSDSLKGIAPDRRKCRHKEETDGMQIFNSYSQTACLMECQLKAMVKKCGCSPWNFPLLNESIPICDYRGVECGDIMINNMDTKSECPTCLNDCDVYKYEYSVSSTFLDAAQICKLEASTYQRGSVPSKLFRFIEKVFYEWDINDKEYCIRQIENYAFVEIQLASQLVTRINRDERTSFADIISNLGGTLGLFTGMSILSLIEFIFWFGRAVFGRRKT